jgi:maleamate amidohydrolase
MLHTMLAERPRPRPAGTTFTDPGSIVCTSIDVRHGTEVALDHGPSLMSSPGFGERAGAGRRPAVLVIDMNLAFTDPASPLVCNLERTVEAIAELLRGARAARVPVCYTTVAYTPADRAAAAVFLAKVPALGTLEAGTRWPQIDPRLAPAAGEPVLTKLFASAFFGTPLQSFLTSWGTDTLIIAGASTSGCVRATAVDALQHGLVPLVPREAVGDRDRAAHEANLRDIELKYGDVISLAQALEYLAALEPQRAPSG